MKLIMGNIMDKASERMFIGMVVFIALTCASVRGEWVDHFVNDSKIADLTDTKQVTDSIGFGTDFTTYAGNPLSTLESCDPWDAGDDITKQIPGSVHPDVLYFPEGLDGYKYWMRFIASWRYLTSNVASYSSISPQVKKE